MSKKPFLEVSTNANWYCMRPVASRHLATGHALVILRNGERFTIPCTVDHNRPSCIPGDTEIEIGDVIEFGDTELEVSDIRRWPNHIEISTRSTCTTP